ncbi:2-amino-3-ketobutyrate CoA ligase [Taibaiella sp. KBW10]|uniref:aminotransferase class I/II-fold pyridoxal phosphate-dependent enzyme n=1 Tax=Taibaiella sp. KBW10 TaxID=2153357 RepID=UPI000F59654D|nr:aminotransferase class I/II-fold pyridoxal phosphate-dependent enzyme [Taibaiella sp. KBW10]RQO30987.1 2-amino-3-ketobutyrate CoA ligase [Taibaiella sp. KBW10]
MTAKISYDKASFKDFENIPDLNLFERAQELSSFLDFMKQKDRLNYRLINYNSAGATVQHKDAAGNIKECVSFVSNDYLGFSQHPAVKQAAIDSIIQYGTGAGSSPLIGGHYEYHQVLEDKLCAFFQREKGSALVYTTGYTANSASLQSLLHKEDIALLDMAVHASVYEGCLLTNTKKILHNNLEMMEMALKDAQHKYRTKLVIIDGIYSQDGDMAPVKEILQLCRQYGAYLMLDDAHGIGVIGKTGRGVLEHYDLLKDIDIITGTLSKTFGNVGGYVISRPEIIEFLQYQSRQNAFSAAATPAITGVVKAIELLDEEPQWQAKLWDNINYLKNGLTGMGLNVGNSCSAIVPVKIGDPHITGDVASLLLEMGVYTNPILYPAVSKKDARIRMSLLATHSREHLDKALAAFEYINKKLELA